MDARILFHEPGRAQRPRCFVVILRGIPGSGKSHLAARIRKLEIAAGTVAPRVLSLDSYFMNEVEQVSGAGRSRKVTMVEEYEHEPDMEGALRAVCCRFQIIISGSLPAFRIVSGSFRLRIVSELSRLPLLLL